eukprot:2650277-Pleurochrysis_carterae.AAC.2
MAGQPLASFFLLQVVLRDQSLHALQVALVRCLKGEARSCESVHRTFIAACSLSIVIASGF